MLWSLLRQTSTFTVNICFVKGLSGNFLHGWPFIEGLVPLNLNFLHLWDKSKSVSNLFFDAQSTSMVVLGQWEERKGSNGQHQWKQSLTSASLLSGLCPSHGATFLAVSVLASLALPSPGVSALTSPSVCRNRSHASRILETQTLLQRLYEPVSTHGQHSCNTTRFHHSFHLSFIRIPSQPCLHLSGSLQLHLVVHIRKCQ